MSGGMLERYHSPPSRFPNNTYIGIMNILFTGRSACREKANTAIDRYLPAYPYSGNGVDLPE
jgi:hypothetical protein